MITDLMARLQQVAAPQVALKGGIYRTVTDEAEAIAEAVRNLDVRWLCLAWISNGTGGDKAAARQGRSSCTIKVAVVKRPQLTAHRPAGVYDEDDTTLAALWEWTRELFCRIRFGTFSEVEGRLMFHAQDGYLDGQNPMAMGPWALSRKTFEITEANATKGLKELLWAETAWTTELALPVYPDGTDAADIFNWFIQAGDAPA